MSATSRTDIDWRVSFKCGFLDAIVWTWFLATLYGSRFTTQLAGIAYFSPDQRGYSVAVCLLVSAALLAMRWDAVPRGYRLCASVMCSAFTLLLLTIAQLGLQGTTLEFVAFILFVLSYYGSQILRIESLTACPDLRSLILALIVSFVCYYALAIMLALMPLVAYDAFLVLAPLTFLASDGKGAPPTLPARMTRERILNPAMAMIALFGIAGGLIAAAGGCEVGTTIGEVFERPNPLYLLMVLASFVLVIVTVRGYQLYRGMAFAALSLVWMVGSLIGQGVIDLFPAVPTLFFHVFAALVALAIVASLVVCRNLWFMDPPAEDHGGTEKLGELAKRCGLTTREREVFELLAEGRSVPYIQQRLYVSEGTARTHVKHIYTKLDVHSKQELLDLVRRG